MSGYAHYEALAERVVLAKLTDDQHAIAIIDDEISGCPHCWRHIAEHLAEDAADRRLGDLGVDGAIADTEATIAHDLDELAEWAERERGQS
jgi:hypothetical protein